MLAFLLQLAISSTNIFSSLPIHKLNLTVNFASIHFHNQNSITLPQMKQISSFSIRNLYISHNLYPFLFSVNSNINFVISHSTLRKFQSSPLIFTNAANIDDCSDISKRNVTTNPAGEAVNTEIFTCVMHDNFTVEIYECRFEDISVGRYGGAFKVQIQSADRVSQGDVKIIHSTFTNCSAKDYSQGGAFYISSDQVPISVTLAYSTLEDCFALEGAAFYINVKSEVKINDCTIDKCCNGIDVPQASRSLYIINPTSVTIEFTTIIGDNIEKNNKKGLIQEYLTLENCHYSTLKYIQFDDIIMENNSGIMSFISTPEITPEIKLEHICIAPSKEASNTLIHTITFSGKKIEQSNIKIENLTIYNPENNTNWRFKCTGFTDSKDQTFEYNESEVTEIVTEIPETLNCAVRPATADFTISDFFTVSDLFTNSDEFSQTGGFSNSDFYSNSISFTQSTAFTQSDLFSLSQLFSNSVEFTPDETPIPLVTTPPQTSFQTPLQTTNFFIIISEDIGPNDSDGDGKSDVGKIAGISIAVVIVLIIIIVIIIVCCRMSARCCAGCCMCRCCGCKNDQAFKFPDDEESSQQELFFPDFGKHSI